MWWRTIAAPLPLLLRTWKAARMGERGRQKAEEAEAEAEGRDAHFSECFFSDSHSPDTDVVAAASPGAAASWWWAVAAEEGGGDGLETAGPHSSPLDASVRLRRGWVGVVFHATPAGGTDFCSVRSPKAVESTRSHDGVAPPLNGRVGR